MSAFSELFINDAMETLGEAFSRGDIRYISGMSGIELANIVLKEYPITQNCKNYELSIGYPPEYWCGWILAYYQWYLGETFLEICQRISYKNLMNLYGVLHEADMSKAVSVLNRFVKKT